MCQCVLMCCGYVCVQRRVVLLRAFAARLEGQIRLFKEYTLRLQRRTPDSTSQHAVLGDGVDRKPVYDPARYGVTVPAAVAAGTDTHAGERDTQTTASLMGHATAQTGLIKPSADVLSLPPQVGAWLKVANVG